jgi:hypothetical protein
MSRLNIHELHRKIHQKNEKKSVCYEKVLEICHKRIISSTEREKTSCLFEFPEYILGYPLFDLNACMEYCKKQLCSNGFLIEYYFPNRFYISWDFEEIKRHKAEQRRQTPLIAILPNTKTVLHSNQLTQYIPNPTPDINQQTISQSMQPRRDPNNVDIVNNVSNAKRTSETTQKNVMNMMPKFQSTPISVIHHDAPKAQTPLSHNLFSPQFHDKITTPIPTSPLKYDPFDVYHVEQTSLSNSSKNTKHGVLDNTFFSGNLKQMLSSGIGSSQSTVFDFKPSGKLSLNL